MDNSIEDKLIFLIYLQSIILFIKKMTRNVKMDNENSITNKILEFYKICDEYISFVSKNLNELQKFEDEMYKETDCAVMLKRVDTHCLLYLNRCENMMYNMKVIIDSIVTLSNFNIENYKDVLSYIQKMYDSHFNNIIEVKEAIIKYRGSEI